MDQNNPTGRIKVWLDAQSTLVRGLAVVGMLVVAGVVLVAIICVLFGWTSAKQLSDALFYASSAMFAVSLVVYFSSSGGPSPSEEDDDQAEENRPTKLLPRRRRREVPFYAITLIAAGIVLFLLSIALYYALS